MNSSVSGCKSPWLVRCRIGRVLTSPPCSLSDLMPSFIRHGPTIPRRTDICPPDSTSSAYAPGGDGIVSRNQSFLRTPVQRPPHEIMRRESNRLSAPSYLARSLAEVPREYGSSSQSFLSEASPGLENGDAGARGYYYDHFYDAQRRRQLNDRLHEDYRYYEHNSDLFQRMSQNHGRHTSGKDSLLLFVKNAVLVRVRVQRCVWMIGMVFEVCRTELLFHFGISGI